MNIVNNNVRIDFIKVDSDNQAELVKTQQKINQWITTGQLVKYEIHTQEGYILFNVCRIKSGE